MGGGRHIRIRGKARHRQQQASPLMCVGEMWACASAFADAKCVCGPSVERCFGEARRREETGEDGGGSTLKNDIE